MTAERLKIKERKDFYWYGVFDGKLDYIISVLQKCKEDGWEGIDYDYYDGEKEYYVYKTRLETDEEYEKRMELEEQRKENRRIQYEQLKKEFGEDTSQTDP
jgi:hypothetical protein